MAPRNQLRFAFGKALQSLRADAGLTQEQLAERADLHSTYISQLERGLKSPTLEIIAAIADALGKKPHELVRAAEDATP